MAIPTVHATARLREFQRYGWTFVPMADSDRGTCGPDRYRRRRFRGRWEKMKQRERVLTEERAAVAGISEPPMPRRIDCDRGRALAVCLSRSARSRLAA